MKYTGMIPHGQVELYFWKCVLYFNVRVYLFWIHLHYVENKRFRDTSNFSLFGSHFFSGIQPLYYVVLQHINLAYCKKSDKKHASLAFLSATLYVKKPNLHSYDRKVDRSQLCQSQICVFGIRFLLVTKLYG